MSSRTIITLNFIFVIIEQYTFKQFVTMITVLCAVMDAHLAIPQQIKITSLNYFGSK